MREGEKMGGRGSSSGIGTKAISVEIDGKTYTYRDRGKGIITGLNDMNINSAAKGKSIADIEKLAKEKGYKYKTYSGKQLAQNDKDYRAQRKAASKQLDELWFSAAPRPRKGMRGH